MTETQAASSNKLPDRPGDLSWPFWPAVPLYPYGRRRTLRTEVIKDTIWTFEQVQGILYVVVPIRMTIVKLEAGGLFVYAPVAPTPECLRLVNKLVEAHGEIKYIILPTVSGIEHKVFIGPFARRFPKAQVFVAPDQWSFPLKLPLTWLGLPWGRTHVLPQNSANTPFSDEFDYAILGPINLGLGPFEEVAFLHRRSRTLLVTDTVISLPEHPPAIVQLDPYPLLFHAKDSAFDLVEDNATNRQKGWQRTILFSLYFRPSVLETVGFMEVVRNAFKAAERSRQAYFGLFPFKWKDNWKNSFDALRGAGRLFVAPILQTLILNRAPKETIDWANQVASWNFLRIIPCHFDSPIEASAQEFRQAFSFLEKNVASARLVLPEADFEFLREIEENLNKLGITLPSQGKV
ncbi:MAG: DUF4336 domain-containing protein [Pseudanabaena sp. RU_4_16]|nr:DUF4336 domain-containing protein [Pseudanabaena sp. SU_2_4]NJM28048.1 DUF4336 domain-containing protein [Pseudanabaena sp. RU_4_16]